MKKILYLSLLLIVPFLLNADHGRDRLNGKWISPYFGQQIKLKVKRNSIKIKGLSRGGWSTFDQVRRNMFEDCDGNTVRINNIHDLVYRNRYRGDRIKFVKKGHKHHNHSCSSSCGIGDDYFFDNNRHDDRDQYGYGEYDLYSGYDNYYNDRYNPRDRDRDRNRNRYGSNRNNRLKGRYFVRELDEFITIDYTNRGIRAKRGNGKWVHYRQNNTRKNEYEDKKGNRYLHRKDGSVVWKSRDNRTSLNLSPR